MSEQLQIHPLTNPRHVPGVVRGEGAFALIEQGVLVALGVSDD